MFLRLRVRSAVSPACRSKVEIRRFSHDTSDWLSNVQKNAQINVSLNALRDNPGAKHSKKRVGRGPASGLGKTAGRGGKGQSARSGFNLPKGFEGGQTPHWKSARKFGFTNANFARRYALVNLDRLQKWIDDGKVNPNELITMTTLFESGLAGKLRRNQVGVKVLGKGADKLRTKVNLEITQISDSALAAVNKLGGSVNLVHYNRVGMKSIVKPERFKGKLPYLAPPPANINRKLKKPMNQPKQHPEWEERQRQLASE